MHIHFVFSLLLSCESDVFKVPERILNRRNKLRIIMFKVAKVYNSARLILFHRSWWYRLSFIPKDKQWTWNWGDVEFIRLIHFPLNYVPPILKCVNFQNLNLDWFSVIRSHYISLKCCQFNGFYQNANDIFSDSTFSSA